MNELMVIPQDEKAWKFTSDYDYNEYVGLHYTGDLFYVRPMQSSSSCYCGVGLYPFSWYNPYPNNYWFHH
jgi:hypothetical protein